MEHATESSARELFRYIIASGEMRYIERTERLVLLDHEPEDGWRVYGMIEGCGSACDVNLTQIILEFIMSCEGLDTATHQAALRVFSQKIAAAMVEQIKSSSADEQIEGLLDECLRCLLGSLGDRYVLKTDRSQISASFADCPLCALGGESGMQRHGELAHGVVFDLVRAVVYKLDPAAVVRTGQADTQKDHGLDLDIIRPIH